MSNDLLIGFPDACRAAGAAPGPDGKCRAGAYENTPPGQRRRGDHLGRHRLDGLDRLPDYALTGKKGTGKSKGAVTNLAPAQRRPARRVASRRVASNLDLHLQAKFDSQSKMTYIRVPDKPSADDLLAIGPDNAGFDGRGPRQHRPRRARHLAQLPRLR